MSLYNSKKFPEYVFRDNTLSTLFFEFNVCFSVEFVEALTKYLLTKQVVSITINNIEPAAIAFNRTIATENMPAEFVDVVKTTLTQNYINAPVNFYMITELAEIYTPENKNLFCLLLDRSFDIAIMATSGATYSGIFDDYKIKDLKEYLSAIMLNNYSEDFDTKLHRNYF